MSEEEYTQWFVHKGNGNLEHVDIGSGSYERLLAHGDYKPISHEEAAKLCKLVEAKARPEKVKIAQNRAKARQEALDAYNI